MSCLTAALFLGASGVLAQEPLVAYRVEGDAIRRPLTNTPGDPARGREILRGRDGNCLLCHVLPGSGERFMGNVGPSLAGVGSRLSTGQVRLRIVDSMRVNRETVMPPYYRIEGLHQVAVQYRGKPGLTAQQVEDVVVYLANLK